MSASRSTRIRTGSLSQPGSSITYGSGPLWPGTVCETWAREGQIHRFVGVFPDAVSIAMSD